MTQIKSIKKLLALTGFILVLSSTYITAYADAPSIVVNNGDPGTPVPPPYTFTFTVTNQTGITSIKVNGKELGPGGGTYYKIEWSTSANGTYTITATDTEGQTSSQAVVLSSIDSSAKPTQASQPQTTAAPTNPPETTKRAETTPTTKESKKETIPETSPVETTTEEETTTQASTEDTVATTQETTVPTKEAITAPTIADISAIANKSLEFGKESVTSYIKSRIVEAPSVSDISSLTTAVKSFAKGLVITPPSIPDISSMASAIKRMGDKIKPPVKVAESTNAVEETTALEATKEETTSPTTPETKAPIETTAAETNTASTQEDTEDSSTEIPIGNANAYEFRDENTHKSNFIARE